MRQQPPDDDQALFDVVRHRDAYTGSTTYVPSRELASALDTAGEFWQATARGAILAMAETRATWTIDDLREDGLVPPPVNPNAWGAAVSGAANAGLITWVGYRKSRRPESHSRVVSVWKRAG